MAQNPNIKRINTTIPEALHQKVLDYYAESEEGMAQELPKGLYQSFLIRGIQVSMAEDKARQEELDKL